MSPKRDYVRQTQRLLKRLKKEGGTVQLQPTDDPMDQLLRGVLSTYASDSRAEVALTKLRDAMIDLNELRVTPIAEIVETIGADYPMCRAAAAEISLGLNSVFNRIHHLDLTFLKTLSRKHADVFLSSLDGVGPHAKATVIQRCLKAHVVPVDVHMYAFLQKNGCLSPGATVEDAQRVLARRIRERDGFTFYALLKRHAAAHARRRPVRAKAKPKAATRSATPTPEKRTPTRAATAAKAPVGKKTVKEKALARESRKKVSLAATAGSKKAATGKKKAASVRKAGSKKTRRPVGKKNTSTVRKASTGRRR